MRRPHRTGQGRRVFRWGRARGVEGDAGVAPASGTARPRGGKEEGGRRIYTNKPIYKYKPILV